MPVDQDPTPDLGGWTAEKLRPTFQESTGAGSDHEIEPETRFMRGVATVVRRRETIDSAHADPKTLSVFLLSPERGVQKSLVREPMLDSGHTTIAGKVWFVNAPVVSGRALVLDVENPDDVFRTVTDDLELGDVPAAIVDQRLSKTEVRYYPKGLNEPDDYKQVRLHCSDLDIHQVCEVVDRVYKQCLITPDAQPLGNKLWKDANNHCPHKNAEHKVQAFLKPAFAAAFPTCRVDDEFAGTMGRADIHLEEQDPIDREKVTFLAVLELKVLRSYSEGGTKYPANFAKKWIEKGVKQAGTYRKERGHRVAALCCFDMRAQDNGDTCFEPVLDIAESLKVDLRRWYLYASSELCRDAVASMTSTSA